MGTIQAISRVKALVRRLAAGAYAFAPGYLRGLDGNVVILTYHRVVSQQELNQECIQSGMYVTAEVFAAHMQFLKRHFTILSLAELLAMWAKPQWDERKRYCVVTFDDGWLDNYMYAFPILKASQVPATIFLPTAYIGTDMWFWPERIGWLCQRTSQYRVEEQSRVWSVLRIKHPWCLRLGEGVGPVDVDAIIEECKRLAYEEIDAFSKEWAAALQIPFPLDRQVMNWDEVRAMSAAGISFGSHSATHKILTTLTHDDVVQEVTVSRESLQQNAIKTVPVFCYPNGNWSEEIGRCVQAAGYEAAVTTQFGYEGKQPEQRYGLKRVSIHQDITCTDALFGFHLAGFNAVGR